MISRLRHSLAPRGILILTRETITIMTVRR